MAPLGLFGPQMRVYTFNMLRPRADLAKIRDFQQWLFRESELGAKFARARRRVCEPRPAARAANCLPRLSMLNCSRSSGAFSSALMPRCLCALKFEEAPEI